VSELPKALNLFGLALVPICCLGLPLLLAAGLSVTALALIGGVTAAVIACATGIALLIARRGGSRGSAGSTVNERARRG
jgi:hypothetical protein